MLLVLGALVGVTAGLATAAGIGATRDESALDRLRDRTVAADVTVFSGQAGHAHPDWNLLRARPEVEQLAVWHLLFGDLDGEPNGLLFAADDGTWLGEINRPVVVAGRMWDESAPDEVLISEPMLDSVPIGTTVEFRAYGPDQPDVIGPPTGPELTFTVVGAVRTINQFVFTLEQAFVSPGFLAEYRDEVATIENADPRLRHPAATFPR